MIIKIDDERRVIELDGIAFSFEFFSMMKKGRGSWFRVENVDRVITLTQTDEAMANMFDGIFVAKHHGGEQSDG